MKTTQFILMLVFAGQVFAGHGERGENALGLTDDQKVQMQEVKQRTHERMEAARASIMIESKAEMAEFLTAEQLEKMTQMHEHRKEHGQMRKQHKKKILRSANCRELLQNHHWCRIIDAGT